MSDLVLSPNNINLDHIESLENSENVSDGETVSDSEIEDDSSAENNAKIHREFGKYQDNENHLPALGIYQSKISSENAAKTTAIKVTVQESTITRVGNETNFHAPLTISHADIYHNKKQKKFPIKRIISFLIAAIVIFSLLTTLLLILV